MVFTINNKVLRAHKTIICARSPVFAAMFSNECKESKENKVTISDISVEVFKEVLQFIYTNHVNQMEEYAMELLIAADKYQISELKSNCTNFIISKISTHSVVEHLIIADQYNFVRIKSSCLDYIT
ncbi:PREDICTED: speckle-type POZ protein-like, partial [Rhagoletis zephyria]|uniref:speckle-type POZ protein-like n=1 Tax=Rhagoletis zephyria TaxID=28612 RepID=UPI0008117096